jgi:hypothetical protein
VHDADDAAARPGGDYQFGGGRGRLQARDHCLHLSLDGANFR